MAYIDKTYITKKDVLLFFDWREKEKNKRPDVYLYSSKKRYRKMKDDEELVLWNTGTIFDYWLQENCPIYFIQERLKEQYKGKVPKPTKKEISKRRKKILKSFFYKIKAKYF